MTDPGKPPSRPLRVALVAPPLKAVPPVGYGGTERVVAALASGLEAAGHDVTVFASGDSEAAGTLAPLVPKALWDQGYHGKEGAYLQLAAARAWGEAERFDIIHSHLEAHGFLMARYAPVPVVTTLHGRLDVDGLSDLLADFPEIPLVAISANQRRWMPELNWVGTVHHGLELAGMPHHSRPGEYLAVVGRISPEKGIAEAIELARLTGIPLKIAAKVQRADEREMFDEIVQPAIDAGSVEFLGEVDAAQRNDMLAGALATLMLGGWPEPFGLVAIELFADRNARDRASGRCPAGDHRAGREWLHRG